MPRRRGRLVPRAVVVLAIALVLAAAPAAAETGSVRRPNVVVLLADDLGYSDIGCFGAEIETPNLDALAAGGLRFAQFYNSARCWPTRAALLTGFYPQQVRLDAIPGVARTGWDSQRPAWATLLPGMLRTVGYRSYHCGKWHLDGQPHLSGFEHSYFVRDSDRYFAPKSVELDGVPLGATEPGYYSTTAIVDHAIGFIEAHLDETPDQPFFQYVAFTVPHFPLQAPAVDIEKYSQRYSAGWDSMRVWRHRRQRALGLLGSELPPMEPNLRTGERKGEWFEALGPDEVERAVPWSSLSESKQRAQATKMAIYAAMIDRMDREIGRLVTMLRERGVLEDTLIFFLSDNGASPEILIRGDGHDRTLPPGGPGTFLCLGPGWSSVANTPFRRHKAWLHEGGISTPLIVHWPRGITTPGAVRQSPGHAIDIVPTVLELVGGIAPAAYGGADAPALPGCSLVPLFTEDRDLPRDDIWWMHDNHQAIRRGNWKLLKGERDRKWRLYDLAQDRAEMHDVSLQHPDVFEELRQAWLARTANFERLARQ